MENKFLKANLLDFFEVSLNKTKSSKAYLLKYNVTNESLPFMLIEGAINGTALGSGIRSQYDMMIENTSEGNYTLTDQNGDSHYFVDSTNKSKGLWINIYNDGKNVSFISNENTFVFEMDDYIGKYRLTSIEKSTKEYLIIERDNLSRINKIAKKQENQEKSIEELNINYGVENDIKITYMKYEKIYQIVHLIKNNNKITRIYSLVDEGSTGTQYDFNITRTGSRFDIYDNKYGITESFTAGSSIKRFINKFGKIIKLVSYDNKCEVYYVKENDESVYTKRIIHYFDSIGGLTNNVKDNNETYLTHFDKEERLQSEYLLDTKYKAKLGKEISKGNSYFESNGQKENIIKTNLFSGAAAEFTKLIVNDSINEYTYKQKYIEPGEKEQVRSLLFVVESATLTSQTSFDVSIEYLDPDDEILETQHLMNINNYGESGKYKYYYIAFYSKEAYETCRICLENTSGTTDFTYKPYVLEGNKGITYNYDEFGRISEVIDGENVKRFYFTQDGESISTIHKIVQEFDGTTYTFTDDGLGNSRIEISDPYNGEYSYSKGYCNKECIESVNCYANKETGLIESIYSNNNSQKFEYNEDNRIKKTIINDELELNYTYRSPSSFTPNILEKIEYTDEEGNELGSNKNILENSIVGNSLTHAMFNDDFNIDEMIDIYKRPIKYRKSNYGFSELEYDSNHNELLKRRDNLYYSYNDLGQLVSISKDNEANVVAEFIYNNDNQISRIIDYTCFRKTEYIYENGIVKEEITLDFSGEEEVEISRKGYLVNEKLELLGEQVSFDNKTDYKENLVQVKEASNIHDLFAYSKNKDKDVYSTFFIPRNYVNYDEEREKFNPFNLINQYWWIDDYRELTTDCNCDENDVLYKNGLYYVDLKDLEFKYVIMNVKSFGLFFNVVKQDVNSQHYGNENTLLNTENFNVKVTQDKLIVYEGKTSDNSIANFDIDVDTWNYLYIEYKDNEFKLYLNNQLRLSLNGSLSFPSTGVVQFSCDTKSKYSIYATGITLSISEMNELFRKELYARFKEIERIEKDTIDRDNIERSAYIKAQTHIDTTSNMDYASFHKDVTTANGLKPTTELPYDKKSVNKNYVFDEELNSFVLNKSSTLIYSLNAIESGTVSINLKRKVGSSSDFDIIRLSSGTNKFELKVTNGNIALYVNDNSVGESYIEDNKWHRYTITWDKKVASSSMEGIPYAIKAYKDGVLISDEIGFELEEDITSSVTLRICWSVAYYSTLLEGLYISDNALSESEVVKLSTNNKVNIVKEYNTSGNIINRKLSNKGILTRTVTYYYDEMNRLATCTSGEDNSFYNEYDDKGLISKVGNPSYYSTYVYDPLNRLEKEINGYNNKTYEYKFDTLGNIVSIKTNGVEKTFTYDSLNRLKKHGDYSVFYMSECDTMGNYYKDGRFLYPNRINTSDGYITLEWTNKRLTKYKKYNSSNVLQYEITYTYDINGLRLSKVYKEGTNEDKVEYYYDLQLLVGEKRTYSTGIVENYKYYYDSNGQVECFSINEVMYFYLRDTKQDICAIIDSQGNIVSSYVYDAYGNILNSLSGIGNKNPFRYKGYYYDEETQLFYCNSRYYSPELCRWISPDSIEYLDSESINGLNLYAYCGNDPINRYDPSGHAWDWVLDVLSVAWSLYDFIKDPTWENAGWLALDVVLGIIPFVPAIGKGLKGLSKVDDLVDIGKGINRLDDVHDAIVIGNGMDRVKDAARIYDAAYYGGYAPLNALVDAGKFSEASVKMKLLARVDNAKWLFKNVFAGAKIIDIGKDGRNIVEWFISAYGMERRLLFYWWHGGHTITRLNRLF